MLRARGVIARQVEHISRMLSDLLDVERVVSGKIRLDREPLDLAEAVRRAVGIDRSRCAVWIGTSRFGPYRCGSRATPMRIEQVLVNIVTNAIKYTPPGGQIRVTLRADGPDAVLVVEDTGAGISSGLLPFIFDLYVQSDRTLDRARGGLGIGLTLVRRLVEAHGGTVDASSEGEGLGSRFTVRLKADSRSGQPPPRRRFRNVAPDRGGCFSSKTATKHGRCCG